MPDKPKVSPDCCEVWPEIAPTFEWYRFEDWPDLVCMPCIRVGNTSWRVNHCPSCGAEIRMVIMKQGNAGVGDGDQ